MKISQDNFSQKKKYRGKEERLKRRKRFEKRTREAAELLNKDAQSSKKSSEEPSGVPLEDLDYDGVVGMENGASDAVDEPVNSEVLKIFPKESEINPDDGLKSIEMETTGLNNDPTNSEIVKNSDPDQTEDHTNQNQGGELESESVQEVTVNGEASKSSENFAKVADETSNPKDIRFFFEDKDMVFGKRRQQDLRKEYRNERTSNCLVIYNPEFKNGECDDGILADLENVYGLFQNLNFKMYRCSNQTAEGIRQKIKKFAELSNHGDAALLIVLTHGDSKGVMGVDKQYFDPMSIFDLLGPEKAPALAGKPKIVLYEHCRGSSEDRGFAIVNDDDDDEVQRANETIELDGKSQSWIPKNADFLINFSTSTGQSSFANKVYGSKHMQIMCQVFAQRAHCDCLEEMLREVRRRMADLEIVRRGGTIFKQMPETHSTLRKSFFFKVRKLE